MLNSLLFVVVFITITAGSAFARGSYVGIEGGVSLFNNTDLTTPGYPKMTLSHDTGSMYGINLGADYDVIRLEGELSYRRATPTKASGNGRNYSLSGFSASALSYMINVIYDFKTDFAVKPFVGVGAGWVNVKLSSSSGSDSDMTFGYQLIAGVSTPITKNINIDASYRFQGSPDLRSNGETWTYSSNNFLVGARLNF